MMSKQHSVLGKDPDCPNIESGSARNSETSGNTSVMSLKIASPVDCIDGFILDVLHHV